MPLELQVNGEELQCMFLHSCDAYAVRRIRRAGLLVHEDGKKEDAVLLCPSGLYTCIVLADDFKDAVALKRNEEVPGAPQ